MSQRLIIAIGISGLVGIVLLVALNVFAAFQQAPTAGSATGTSPTPAATTRGGAGSSATPRTTSEPPETSAPGPTGSGGPSATPGPVGVEADQSRGTLTLTITAPGAVELSSPTACEWAADEPLRVEQVVTVQGTELELRGERVAVQIRTSPVTPPTSEETPLLLRRLAGTDQQPRAPYGFSGASDGELVQDLGQDGSTGSMTFKGLGSIADDIPPDQLPVRRVIYGVPLGEAAEWERIDGKVTWQCDGAPAGFTPTAAVPSPTPVSSDDPTVLRAPELSLEAGDVQRRGTLACLEAATSRDGQHTGADECPSAWVAPSALPQVASVRAGARVGVSPEDGWRIAKWELRAFGLAEVEETLGEPKSSRLLFRGDREAPVPAVFFRAPPRGTWLVRATLQTQGPGSATARATWYFVLRTT